MSILIAIDASKVELGRPMPGVNAALADAFRQLNAAFARLSKRGQETMDIRYDGLDRAIDSAILAGDRDRALAAIRAWREHWLHEIGRAGR